MNIPSTNQCRVHTIVGEVQSVIATMRNNNRFSALSTRESPLLKEFKQLRSQLRPSTDIEKLDPMIYLKPFLNVIHSEETSGPITGAALNSVDKFLTYGFLKDSPLSVKAMKKIADTVVHCRFEATSVEGDDVVLMRLLRVLLSCLACPAGGLLSDDNVFEMISICYRMSRGRLSELLKKTAERTLTELVHIIFLVNNIHNKSYFSDQIQKFQAEADESLIPPPSPPTEPKTNRHDSADYINPRGVRFQRLEQVNPAPEGSGIENGSTTELQAPAQGEYIPKPYGVGCVLKTFKFLVELTSPNDENIPESLRQISIQLLNTIAETQPQLIERIPPLLELLCNNLCKSMLQNLHSDNLDRLNLTMRLFFNLYISLRRHLKVQFEVFFNNLLRFILHNNKFVSFEKQEIVLENLVQFFYQPSFMTDMFANFDCHIHCTNTMEKLSTFLYKSTFPLNGTLYSIQLLSLECLLALLETISSRCTEFSTQAISLDTNTADLLHQRASKAQFIKAAAAFNKKPAHGLQFLQEQEMLPRNPSIEEIARFLRNAPGLNKKQVGEYLGKQSKEFVRAYVKTFDFTGIDFVDSLRLFLTSFVMSGEAQIIDRIVESFAHHWFYLHPRNVFASADVAYVVCYSIVLLNVDAHNTGVKNKMTEEQYISQLRGVNDGKDFPREFLQDVYKCITHNEIKISDDSPEGEINDDKWVALLQRNLCIGPFVTANVNALDKDVFLLVCRSIVSALSTVFETTSDVDMLENVLTGFSNCSKISSYFKLSAVFDNVIVKLCKFTSLLHESKPPQYSSSPKRITIFGTNKKAQIATTSMFNLVLRHGDHLREAWRQIVRCIITLNEMELLDGLIDKDPFEGKKKAKKVTPKEGTASTGLLSFIPGWWGSTEPVEEEINPSDVEAEKCAKQTVANCSINSIVESSCQLQTESLVYFIKALILDSAPPNNNSQFNETNAMFCLDLLTKTTLINHSRINFVWVLVSDHFASIVQMAKTPSEYVEKAIICLLLLCVSLAPKKEISSHIFATFELFLKLSPPVASAMSESIIIAVSQFLKTHSESITSKEAWKIILELVERSANFPLAYERGFQTLVNLLEPKGSSSRSPIFTEKAFRPFLRAVLAYVNINEGRKPRKDQPPQPILSSSQSNQAISIRAMDLLFVLFEKSPHSPRPTDPKAKLLYQTKIWNTFWLPIFNSWIGLCRDPRNDVRFHVMSLLQKSLLSQHLDVLTPEGIRNCFEEVMFPLLESLLKPFPNIASEASRVAVEETRVRAQQLLSKTLLQYLPQLTQLSDFHTKLWPQILCMIEAYMHADQNGLLREAIPEVLKNILLVMLQMNVFHPSNTVNGKDIWTVSWMTIDGFCPSLKENEMFRASLNTFQRVPVSSQTTIEEASSVIHQLAKEASSPRQMKYKTSTATASDANTTTTTTGVAISSSAINSKVESCKLERTGISSKSLPSLTN